MKAYKIEVLSDEEQLIKDVYCHYGLASYVAQCFEQELIIFLSFFDIFELKKEHIANIDAVFAKYQKITCGKLIGALHNLIDLDNETREIISKAHQKRNYLTHTFFYEKAVSFISEDGQIEMIDELMELRELFEQAEKRLHLYLEPLFHKYGITQDVLDNALETLIKTEQL
jgi:F0F1-type ATP synthase beta subunit